jgi:molybdopterin/thiamine biosynthesis adenylyltransferase/nitroreductase
VFDTILLQLRDLLQSRHPSGKLTPAKLDALVAKYLDGIPLSAYGIWVYYPWSARLVHVLDEAEFVELRTNRNRYKITSAEQDRLSKKRIGVVGLSVGQSAAAVLALERSFGELRLADFDTVDLSNLNRIRAGVHALGSSKVHLTAREVAEIDPFLKLELFPQGISAENVEAFLLEGGKLDVVIEECDSLDVKVLIRQHARQLRIPVVMDTSDRSMLDIERFDLEPNRPLFHGLAGDLDTGALSGLTTEEKIPYVLRILGVDTISPRLRSSMLEVGSSLVTWPQLGSAVSLGGAAAADAARRVLLGNDRGSGRFFFDVNGKDVSERVDISAGRRVATAARYPSENSLARKLVSAAILAPSGGNTQPWQWLAADSEIRLLLDTNRVSGLIDFENCGAYAALGCAAENLLLAAHASGLEIELSALPTGGGPRHVAGFRFSNTRGSAEPHWRDELHAQIPLRHTQRCLGRHRLLADGDLTSLTEAVCSVSGANVQWVTDEGAIGELGKLSGAGDRLRILNQRMHKEMFREIRWSDSETEGSRDGIDIETLGLSQSDRAGLELCRDWSALELVHELRGGFNLEKISRKQMEASAAVGLITMPRSTSVDYFHGGRALQRMWLAATERGIGIHPIATLPYFFARMIRGCGSDLDEWTMEELFNLRPRYEAMFELAPMSAEVLLFRAGFATDTGRCSLRRSVDEVLTFCRSTSNEHPTR